MANTEYLTARNMALRANEIANASACKDAFCCENSVPLTSGDIGVIVKDIRSGKITEDIVNDAIARSQSPEHEGTCPFLNSENKCSIYDSRPLVCITWGIGGDPVNQTHYFQAVKDYKEGGPSTYPNLLLI